MRHRPKEGYPNPVEPPGLRGDGDAMSRSPISSFWGRLSWPEYLRRSDVWPLYPEGELFAIIMIETQEGINNLNDILDVPGIGAIMIGPNDLSLSLGLGGNNYMTPAGKQRHEEAIQTIL